MLKFTTGLCVIIAWVITGGPIPTALADTYYVSASDGNDTNAGTSPQQAWATLDRVNEKAFKPGDRMLFRSGDAWQGQLKPKGSGRKNAPIVIDQYGRGQKPHIQGKGVMPAAVLLENVEYWKVNNLQISNQGSERKPGRNGIMVRVHNFGTAHDIQLKHLDIHDVNGSLVKDKGGGHAIYFKSSGQTPQSRLDGLLIEDCTIRRCERDGIKGGGYANRNQWHPHLNVVIRDNLIEQIPGDAIVPFGCDGALVEHNVARDFTRMLPEGEAAAGIWPWACDNTIIQFNEVSDHKAPWDGQGFDSDWNCNNTLIQYNYSHDNEGGFLLVCTPTQLSWPSDHNSGTVVRYNISVNDGLRRQKTRRGDYFSPAIHLTGPVRDTHIYNNLIFMHEKPAEHIDATFVHMDNWGGDWPIHTTFANNIFVTNGDADFTFGKARHTTFTHNLYWQQVANLPEDPSAVIKAPGFRDPPSHAVPRAKLMGFMPSSASPLLRAGQAMPNAGQHDFSGHPLPAEGAPSIGPLEPRRVENDQ
jgi:hypothetical protein